MERKWIGICAASAALLLSACSKPAETQAYGGRGPARAVPVIAEPLGYEPTRTKLEAVGTSRAILSANLFPASAGEVVAVNLEPGQLVKKGDVLVQLDDREAKLAVKLARLKLEDAERLLDRYSRSGDSGAVLPTTVDAARTAVELAKVELASAQIALADRSVEAVFDGHVGITDIDPGDRVSPDTMITSLDDRSALLVTFSVPEQYIGELAAGSEISLAPWSTNEQPVVGVVVDLGARIDPVNRSFTARARVDNSDDRLRPGMSFRVEADVMGPKYATVDETGLQWGADGAYVWAVVNDVATRVPVRVVQRRAGRVLIEGELPNGLLVVVEGTQSVREGSPVNIDEDHLSLVLKRRGAVGSGEHAAALD